MSEPLTGWRLAAVPGDDAARYAATLLAALGARENGTGPPLDVAGRPDSGGEDWAASGAMALTGTPGGPPLTAPGAPATAARAAVLALESLAGPLGFEGHHLLGERAAVLGLTRRAPWSAGGHCRAVRAADGWVAVSLARPEDSNAVAAMVETQRHGESWDDIDAWARTQPVRAVEERAQLLGIPAAAIPASPARVWPPWQLTSLPGEPAPAQPLVVDLSTLWAGPLCGSLLQRAGADVVRVETTQRPDGGRAVPAFDDLLHGGQPSVAVDIQEPAGRAALRALVGRADVVLTSARTRALQGLGLDPESYVRQRRNGVWVAITAHPRRPDGTEWVGFGDDTAMSAGLVRWSGDGTPLPCGDALADPLTGVHAALAAWAGVRSGGRHLAELNLHDVAASTLVPSSPTPDAVAVRAPQARRPTARARPLGADTRDVLSRLFGQ